MDPKLLDLIEKLKSIDAYNNDELCCRRFSNCLRAIGKKDYGVAKFYIENLKKDFLYIIENEVDDEYSYVKALVDLEKYVNQKYIEMCIY